MGSATLLATSSGPVSFRAGTSRARHGGAGALEAGMSVLAHDCRYSPNGDDGLPFRRSSDPVTVFARTKNNQLVRIPSQRGTGGCDCVRRISARDARELVARGLAVWKRQRNANGRMAKNHGEIILLKQHPLHAHLVSQNERERRP